jgi:hypothetical protein
VNYIKRKAKIYGSKLKIYATSVAGSVIGEGAEASAAGHRKKAPKTQL